MTVNRFGAYIPWKFTMLRFPLQPHGVIFMALPASMEDWLPASLSKMTSHRPDDDNRRLHSTFKTTRQEHRNIGI